MSQDTLFSARGPLTDFPDVIAKDYTLLSPRLGALILAQSEMAEKRKADLAHYVCGLRNPAILYRRPGSAEKDQREVRKGLR